MQLIHANHWQGLAAPDLVLDNTVDVRALSLPDVQRIALCFPAFTDGRALTQAVWLRTEMAYAGELIATGDVLADHLAHMHRCGFDVAVLRADQDMAVAQRCLQHFDWHYQTDVRAMRLYPTPEGVTP